MKLSTVRHPLLAQAPLPPRQRRLRDLQANVLLVRQRRAPGKRPQPQRPPVALTHSYLEALLVPVRSARAELDRHLVDRIPALARQVGNGQLVHGQVQAAVAAAEQAWARKWPAHRLQRIAGAHAQQVSAFQRAELTRQLRILGIPSVFADRAGPKLVAAFTAHGASKLQALVAAYFADVLNRTLRVLKPKHGDQDQRQMPPDPGEYELRGSVSAGGFVLELGKRADVAEGRTGQLADLDTRGLFGDLNQDRQRELGLLEYVWQTMEDDRVRPSHAALDQKVFDWENPPSIGHPGEPPNCRCQAIPHVPR